MPDKLRERIFDKLFETAEITKFTPVQIRSYEDSLKYYRDLKNSLDTAKEEGLLEGIAKGIEQEKLEVAREMILAGEPIENIIRYTGLIQQQIERLK